MESGNKIVSGTQHCGWAAMALGKRFNTKTTLFQKRIQLHSVLLTRQINRANTIRMLQGVLSNGWQLKLESIKHLNQS
jgi:hypothetical protein